MQDNTYGKYVGADISREIPIREFWCHVVERPAEIARRRHACPIIRKPGYLEIDEFHRSVVTEENVAGLNVAMDDSVV